MDEESTRGWPAELSCLDRHQTSGPLMPDTASLEELLEIYRVPGVSLAAAGRDGKEWRAGYGTVGGGRADRIGEDTVFQACSISKHVSAFGLLRLVADGVVDLDSDMAGYLTSWQLPPGEAGWQVRVTVRQLLAHTAGLSYNWFRGYDAAEPAPSLPQVLRGEPPANTPPVRPVLVPGSRFRYSGSHYAVLQQLMTDVTGMAFEELMRTLVLDPAGMRDSSFDQQFPFRRTGLTARGHHLTGTPVPGGWRVMPEMAGAGLWTTPGDLVRLELTIAEAVAGRSSLLDRDLAAQMVTPQVPGGMGLGTQIDDSGGRLRFGHTGGNVGYCCFSFAWPAAGTAVAVMANSEGAAEILRSVLAAAERRYGSSRDAEAVLAGPEVTGRYLLRDDYPVIIETSGDTLRFTAAGQPPVELVRLPGGRYRVPGLDCEVMFECADGTTVMHIRQEGNGQTAARMPGDPLSG